MPHTSRCRWRRSTAHPSEQARVHRHRSPSSCRACSRRQIVVFDLYVALVPIRSAPAVRLAHAAGRKGLELDCAPLPELCSPPEAELDCDGEPFEFGSTFAMPTAARSTSNRPDATAATMAAMPDAGLPAVPAEITAAPLATWPVTPSTLVAVGIPPAEVSSLPVKAWVKAAFCCDEQAARRERAVKVTRRDRRGRVRTSNS